MPGHIFGISFNKIMIIKFWSPVWRNAVQSSDFLHYEHIDKWLRQHNGVLDTNTVVCRDIIFENEIDALAFIIKFS